jgi:RimJ/RimL family protein N-acetyltransferase
MLRAATLKDAETFVPLRSDVGAQHLLMANPPSSPVNDPLVDAQDWIKRRDANGWFRVISGQDGVAAGFTQIFDIHHKNRTGWFGIALLPSARGKGLASITMTEIEQAARIELELHKLILYIRSDNTASLRLFDRVEWPQVGRLREHNEDGENRHDVIVYERILVDL